MKNKLGNKGALLVLGAILVVFLLVPTILSYVVQYGATKEFGTSGMYKEAEVKELSEELLAVVEAKDFEGVLGYIAEKNRENVKVEDIKTLYEAADKDWGALKEVKGVELYELKQMGTIFAVTKTTAVFDKGEIIVKFIYDENMTLVDFSAEKVAK